MCTRKLVFKNKNDILTGFKGNIDKSYPQLMTVKLNNMFKQDPKERYSCDELAEIDEIK
jgi:hypothetical protein